jgi:hypothetical protein
MQLGTRWPVGGTLPDRLPEVVQTAVRQVEEDLSTEKVDTAAWRWTLTWLEGSPVIELDDGTVIRYRGSDDSATITLPAEHIPDEFDEDGDG